MRVARAFTAVELLIAVVVVAVLIAMLLPALSRARSGARQTECAAGLRQQVVALHMYADAYAQLPVSSVHIGFAERAERRGVGSDSSPGLGLPLAIAEFLDAPAPRATPDGDIEAISPWTCPAEKSYDGPDAQGRWYIPDGYSYGYGANGYLRTLDSRPYDMHRVPDRTGLGREILALYLREPSYVVLYDDEPFHDADPASAVGASGRNHAFYDGSVKQH